MNGAKVLALPPIPDEMLGQEAEVLSSFAIVPEIAKRIENVGKAYARLQGKVLRAQQRAQIAEGKDKDKKGRKIVVADSSDDEAVAGKRSKEEEEKARCEESPEGNMESDEDELKYGNKRKKRTKEDIEREALLLEDLYGTLGLADK